MKTNKILMAVALPALLAACTAEEVVEQSSIANLGGRAMLDPDFSVGVAEGVDSRFAWEGLNWKWEAGDQFGAGVVDPAEYGDISNSSMLGNYIFVKDGEKYKTDSQMSEGTYMFYSYDGFKTKSSRSLVSFDISSQKTDMSNPEAMINDYSNQLMFSPLFDIEAEYSKEKLPLEFRSFWGVAAFKFKNNTGQTLKISQIVLQDNTNNFIVKGGINPEALDNENLKYVYNENGAKYNGTKGTAKENNYVPVTVDAWINDESTTLTEEKRLENIEKAYEAFENALYTTSLSKDVEGNGTSSFIALNCQNYKMKHGETATVYMLVPEHKGENLSAEIMVVNEDEKSQSVYVNGSDVEGLSTLRIQRHKTNAIFGKTTDGQGMKTYSFTEDDLEDNTGYYIDSNKALINLINANLGSIIVHNTGDTYIDAEVVRAIKEYTGAHVTFSNAIEIKDAEALVYNENNDTDLRLTEITFEGGAVVKGADGKKEIKGIVEFGSGVSFNGELVIKEGANVTLKSGSYKNITNWGNLTVEGNENNGSRAVTTYSGTITNEAGAVTLKGSTPKVNMKAGSLSYVALDKKVLEVPSTDLTMAAGANLTIGEYVTLKMSSDLTIGSKLNEEKTAWGAQSIWTNNGAIEIVEDKTLTVNYKLVNNGVVDGKGTLKTARYGSVKVDGKTAWTSPKLENNAGAEVLVDNVEIDYYTDVDNYGKLGVESTNAKIYGNIVMKSVNSRLKVTDAYDETADDEATTDYVEGYGRVNNSANGVVDAVDEMLVYAEVGGMTDGETLAGFDEDAGIELLVVNGTWVITAPEAGKKTAEDELDRLGIEEVRFTAKQAVDVRSKATLDLSGVLVTITKQEKVKFAGRTAKNSTLLLGNYPVSISYVSGNNTIVPVAVFDEITMMQSAASIEASLAEGNDVVLFTDVVLNEALMVSGNAVLDLNGKTITSSKETIYESGVVSALVCVKKGAELTIKNGKIDATGTEDYAVETRGGKLVIESGTFIGAVTAVNCNEGLITINNGYFKQCYESEYGSKFLLNCLDNNYKANPKKADIVVKGGTFYNFNPAVNYAEGENTNFMIDGATLSGINLTTNKPIANESKEKAYEESWKDNVEYTVTYNN